MDTTLREIRLKKGREKSISQGHPWVFSGAIEGDPDDAEPGEILSILSSGGEFLAFAQYSPSGSILFRVMETAPGEMISEGWIRKKIQKAIQLRKNLSIPESNAHRLIFSESDYLPGVIADRFGECVVYQPSTAWADRNRKLLSRILLEETGARSVYERGAGDARSREGLPERIGFLTGEKRDFFSFEENGFAYRLNPDAGQKTGYYADQRENRRIVENFARDRKCLDAFCYTGGFTLSLLRGGAREVICLDSSGEALEELRENLLRNGFREDVALLEEADVFEKLRRYRDRRESFDLIVLDPPKLAPSRKNLEKALRAYKDLNLLAMKLLNPGGILATFSCSGSVSPEDFRRMLGWAAVDAGREVRILHRMFQGPDHPVRIGFPEAEYLKGFLLTVE